MEMVVDYRGRADKPTTERVVDWKDMKECLVVEAGTV